MRACTYDPAQSIGIDDRAGTLATGKESSFVLLDREDLSVRAIVFKDRVVASANIQIRKHGHGALPCPCCTFLCNFFKILQDFTDIDIDIETGIGIDTDTAIGTNTEKEIKK